MTRNPILAVLMALLLAATSILSGPAMARAVGTTVELCAGDGTVTVALDDRGRPVPAHSPCPLCLPTQHLGLPPAPATCARAPDTARAAPPAPATPLMQGRAHARPAARDPPLPV